MAVRSRLGLTILSLMICGFSPARAEVKKPLVITQTITPAPLFDEVTYPARIASQVQANILSDVDGVVTKINRAIGTSVQMGTPLILVKNTDPVYEYVPVAVKSSVAGVVSVMDLSVGSMVHRGQVIAVVTDPAKTILKLEVTSRDLPLLTLGTKGTFDQSTLDTSKNLLFKISGISPVIDPATGTASVEMTSITPAGKKLPIGMLGKVSFRINERKAITLPEEALVYRGKDVFARVVSGTTVKYVKVQTLSTQKGRVEISTGLKPGDVVITRTSMFVADGQEVTPQASDVTKM